MRRTPRLLAMTIGLALLATACGGDDDAATETTATDTAAVEDTGTATDTSMEDTATEDTGTAMEDTSMEDTGTAMEDTGSAGTIVDVASQAGDFTTLVAAVEAAGLTDTLNSEGPYTVFAPTDAAFQDALETLDVTADELLANPDLADILTYHVVEGEVLAEDVMSMDGESVPTVNGMDVTITVDGETVMVNDATVTEVDIPASNGVIHVIDTVLFPSD